MINSRSSLKKQVNMEFINRFENSKNFMLKILIDILIILIIFVTYLLVYFYHKPNLVYLTCYYSDIIYPFKNEFIYFWVV